MSSQWRSVMPRTQEEEDEDVKRAIAESLGQVYIPPKKKNKIATQSSKYKYKSTYNYKEELFEPQHPVTYLQAVDMLLNVNCCFALYDKKIKQWRTAVFIKKWDNKNRLMVRFPHECLKFDGSSDNYAKYNIYGVDKFFTIKDFPVNNIKIILKDDARFYVTERDLRDKSNVPKENINAWIQIKSRQAEIVVARFIKNLGKIQIPCELNHIIIHYYFRLLCGLPIILNEDDSKESNEEDQDDEDWREDWSERTDFSGITLVGYLCDDGEVIQGDCLRQKPGKIFVHFNTDAGHFGNKYDWIPIPNERICPPPKNRPKQRKIGFPQEMTAIYDCETSYMPSQE